MISSDFKQYSANRFRSKSVLHRVNSLIFAPRSLRKKKSITVVGLGMNFLPKLNHTPTRLVTPPPPSYLELSSFHHALDSNYFRAEAHSKAELSSWTKPDKQEGKLTGSNVIQFLHLTFTEFCFSVRQSVKAIP